MADVNETSVIGGLSKRTVIAGMMLARNVAHKHHAYLMLGNFPPEDSVDLALVTAATIVTIEMEAAGLTQDEVIARLAVYVQDIARTYRNSTDLDGKPLTVEPKP